MISSIFRTRYAPIFVFSVLYLCLGFLLRIVLMVITPEELEFASLGQILFSFILGAGFDIVTASYVFFLWFLFISCIPLASLASTWYKCITILIATMQTIFLYFNFVSEITFWEEFTSRFNFIAVDYLVYTHEVIQNIIESYPLPLLLSLIAFTAFITVFLLRKKLFPSILVESKRFRLGFPILYILFVLVSGIFVNSTWKNFSSNTLNNSLAGNGTYEFVSAFFNNQLDYQQFYKTIPLEEAIQIVKQDIIEEGGVFLEPLDSKSFYHKRVAKGEQNNLNMVLIIVESFSSKYLTQFGEKRNLTPYLDSLSKNSLFFSNLFATGTRTVRGLEALSLSIPPTPGQSIVRRKNNTDFITMGEVLTKAGYDSFFFYGGYGYFDNMNAYFSGNSHSSFDRVDIPDSEVVFGNAWGVADESLYDAVIKSIDNRTSDKPFFYNVLTTSNHRPFTYPDNRIDTPSGEGRHGAVRYTDWSIEDFIKKASKKPWFKDTIFVVVADHTAGGAGKTNLPLIRYHIPMFIYAPEHIKPQRFETLTSQIDVVPTLLGLLNMSYTSSFMGYDMLNISSPKKARLFIGTYQDLGYFKDGVLTILQPKSVVRQENASTKFINQTVLKEPKPEDIRKAIAYYEYASFLFTSGLLRIPAFTEKKE